MKTSPTAFKQKFAHRLRTQRMLARFETAQDFAAAIGEQPNTYTRWERGEVMPSLEQLVRIAYMLGLTPNDLLWPRLRPGEEFSAALLVDYGVKLPS